MTVKNLILPTLYSSFKLFCRYNYKSHITKLLNFLLFEPIWNTGSCDKESADPYQVKCSIFSQKMKHQNCYHLLKSKKSKCCVFLAISFITKLYCKSYCKVLAVYLCSPWQGRAAGPCTRPARAPPPPRRESGRWRARRRGSNHTCTVRHGNSKALSMGRLLQITSKRAAYPRTCSRPGPPPGTRCRWAVPPGCRSTPRCSATVTVIGKKFDIKKIFLKKLRRCCGEWTTWRAGRGSACWWPWRAGSRTPAATVSNFKN